ncbi:MAG: hypothetical protein RQ827_01700 [Thermocrinis sp.]|nr:hypothetical protein [Thermocrinis sp.]
MKKLIFVFLSLFIFSTITLPEPSLAATQQKTASVKSSKKKAVKQKKKVKVKSSRHAKKKYAKKNVLKVRYSHNINKPQEGDLLKLEGMVKDLNEQ